ncbi:MAG: M48 family metallopeptidase [Solimonas sp.]
MADASYYDGRSALRHAVRLELDGGELVVRGDAVDRREPLPSLRVSARIGRAPRTITFADGAVCEVRDHDAFESLLRQMALQGHWLHKAEGNWRIIAVAVVVIAACAAAFVVWGVPLGAQWFAQAMPPRMTQALSEQSLKLLDGRVLKPSKLDAERAADLTGAVEGLRAPDGSQPVYRLEFRSSASLGPNAFALPDGTIVLLDELVNLADNDEQILAVVGHELGHVHHRHGLRLIAQSSAVGVLAAWWLGDVSTILATAPAALMQARYSREFEAEADRYAAGLMQANGIAPARLAEILRKLEATRPIHDEDGIGSLLDSHPGLLERAQSLDGGRSDAERPAAAPN